MEVDQINESSDEETKERPSMAYKVNGTFQTKQTPFVQKPSYYPNLQVLKNLLTIDSIRDYPKLSLLAYEALHPYMEVFDNEYVSFFKQCLKHNLIEKVCQKTD